jgi:KDO2-lipid IV(A) lauroyltransferase
MSDHLPAWRRLRRGAWYVIARTALAATAALPPRWGRRLCQGLARLALRWRGEDRRRAQRNLARAFPRQPAAWRRQLLTAAADALGDSAHAALTCERAAARGFPDIGQEAGPDGRTLLEVLAAARTRGRGVLLVTAHLGCWELLAAWLARELGGAAVVTGRVRNPPVDRLLQARRRRLGLEVLPRHHGVRPVLRALAAGRVVGVLVDQNTRVASAPLPFLGHPAPTPLGAARIACRRQVPVVPAVLVRQDHHWLARHGGALDPGADPLALAGRCNALLGDWIRRNPAQWVWFHDRWNEAATPPAIATD